MTTLYERRIGSERLGLTVGWAIQKLESACARFKEKVQNGGRVTRFECTKLAAESGFMSYVYRCDFYFDEEEECLAYCLKEPNAERMNEILGFDFYPILMDRHDRECQFYETFPTVKGLNVPEIFDIKRLTKENKNGYIFMEFVGQGKWRSIDPKDSLTLDQMLSIADQIAHLHAYGLKNKQLWEGRFEDVNIVAASAEEAEQVFGRLEGSLRQFCDEDILSKIEQLKDILHDHTVYDFALFKAHLEAGCLSVVSHGDLWANNVLFKVDEKTNQLTSNIGGIVDWQGFNAGKTNRAYVIFRLGNPAQDLQRIMLFNMDAKDRYSAEPKVFDFYYKKLGEYLKELGEGPVPFGFDQLLRAARSYFIYQLALIMFVVAHSFPREDQAKEKAVFLERLRHGLDQVIKTAYLWK